MNAELETNINQTFDWLQKTGGAIQDFATEQAPLYCREIVAWEFWNGLVGTIIGVVALTVGIISLFKFIKWMHEDDSEPNGRTLPALGLTLIGIVTGAVCLSDSPQRMIKAAVAPRLVIVEHLRGLKP
jgi:hypothetical protein